MKPTAASCRIPGRQSFAVAMPSAVSDLNHRRFALSFILAFFFAGIGCNRVDKPIATSSDSSQDAKSSAESQHSQVLKPIDAEKEFAATIAQISESGSDGLLVQQYAVTDDMLSQLSEAPTIETLLIDRGNVSSAGIKHIVTLKKLRHLRLRQSPIDDEGLELIANCNSIWFLNLPQADCTNEGVAKLQSLTQLRNLRLGSKKLNNDVCKQIANIKSLLSVHLIGVPVDDDGLKELASLPNLESLYLDDSVVTDAGWKWLFQEHADMHVHVDQNHHDRDPTSHKHD